MDLLYRKTTGALRLSWSPVEPRATAAQLLGDRIPPGGGPPGGRHGGKLATPRRAHGWLGDRELADLRQPHECNHRAIKKWPV